MIKVEKMSYSFPDKDLYREISFAIEDGQHAVLIGSNGTGKTTLVNMLIHTDDYLYDGKITKTPGLRMGYVSQYVKHEKDTQMTVFDYLAQDFVQMMTHQDEVCNQMAEAEDFDAAYEAYQKLMDEFAAIDGYNYESNIHKQLKIAGLTEIEQVSIAMVSGGEFKLLQVIREMLLAPDMMIMDEPDVFLDFENINGLRDLINAYKGTLLVITHNRYLLNHCFNKILHLENEDLHAFDGNYAEYNLNLLQLKIEMQEAHEKMSAWIEIQEKVVENLRADATRNSSPNKGRFLKGRVTYLERLKATRTKAPFVDIRLPKIHLPENITPSEAAWVLKVEDYGVTYDQPLLEHVSFEIGPKEKVALVGPNGTGKTTMLRELWQQARAEASNSVIQFGQDANVTFLSQLHSEMLNEANTLVQEIESCGMELRRDIVEYLKGYYFEDESLDKKVEVLSGGEKNLLQLAKIALGDANLLILDEPTSHLDTWSQIALEQAIEAYEGAILMVSHDFYSIANCADYILYVDDHTVRRMSSRAFRKMIYKNHFSKDYLELEQKKKELELKAETCLHKKNYKEARIVCEQLEKVLEMMKNS